jgi:hypothetical protein
MCYCSSPACGAAHCGFNADRDYCAAHNIARLGIAWVPSMQHTGSAKAFAVTEIVEGLAVSHHWHTARFRCFRRAQTFIASWKEASSTSMAGRKPSPCARRMPPRYSYDCVAEWGMAYSGWLEDKETVSPLQEVLIDSNLVCAVERACSKSAMMSDGFSAPTLKRI